MTDARLIPDAVQWHEGMLLSPQHFQQADLRNQALQGYMGLVAAPYGWGVRRLRINEAALMAGRFAVTDLEAVMPDGMLVQHADAAAANTPILELDLRSILADPLSPRRIAIHVTVAEPSPLALRTGEQRRFRQIEGPEVSDENTGDNAIRIPRLVPRLALAWTDAPLAPPPARFVSLPLAVLENDGSRFNFADYEPPRFRMTRDTVLHRRATALATAMRAKATDWDLRLSNAWAEGQSNTVADGIATLRTIVRGLPRLEALLSTETAHPFDVYLALCDVVGHLAVASGRLILPPLDVYAHADPLAAFSVVTKLAHDGLENLRTPYTSVVFARAAAGRFELTVEPAYLQPNRNETEPHRALVIGARVGPGQDVGEVRAWFNTAVIGTASRIETMRRNAVIGARREAIAGEPKLDLIAPPNMLLFRVAVDPVFVSDGETLQISLLPSEGQTEPVELRLFFAAAGGSTRPKTA